MAMQVAARAVMPCRACMSKRSRAGNAIGGDGTDQDEAFASKRAVRDVVG